MILPRTKLTSIAVALAMSGSFHFGYQVVVPNPAADVFHTFLNDSFFNHFGEPLDEQRMRFFWPTFLNLFPLGGFFGSLSLKALAEKIGRRKSFFVVVGLQGLGCLLSALAYFTEAWELLAFGRFVSGISVGISMGLQPLYLSETSPKEVFGFLNAMTGTFLELGFVLGAIAALPVVLGSVRQWHWLFWLEALTLLPACLVLPFVPETPKFLLASKRDYRSAKEALKFFQHIDVQSDIEEIRREINSEKHTLTLKAIFGKSHLRLGLILGTLSVVAGQCSGIQTIGLYSTYLLTKSGVPAHVAPYATVAISFNTLLAAVIASNFVDRLGRRPLMLWGLVALAVLNLIFMIFTFVGKSLTSQDWPGYVCLASNVAFTFAFGMGPAVVSWFVAAELMPQNGRSVAVTFAQVAQWLCSGIINAVFYPLEGAIHEWSFCLFVAILIASSIYLYWKFPETKNKSTIEIMKLLGYRGSDQDEITPVEINTLINEK